jgi:hypothetical protein
MRVAAAVFFLASASAYVRHLEADLKLLWTECPDKLVMGVT